ncbi:MAG: cytochrome o ubiquinol oxidase subunit III [Chlamydiales bacterium]
MALPLEIEREIEEKTIFGFWVYIMTDCLLFGTLFAIYVVLQHNTNGGPSGKELFSLPHALAETIVLLTSSFTCAMANLAAQRNDKNKLLAAFAVTFLLGVSFLVLELTEFTQLVQQGNSWRRSGFLSGFFTLVGTHGLHITTGLIWTIILLVPVIREGITRVSLKRLKCLRLFWHFLDVVWVFIFTVVYLMGAL